ncbi:hypothetical protein AMTR_s00030p00235630 [Amborella trichopoda]|uniref:Uncharacterized protein n=1 Tax=Amborella trichopoda TaxID=13333 RepID=U5D181_AMBTC|nr:hypothetical protein AMTR_s00030p00235630 [Amborella trichopoda]
MGIDFLPSSIFRGALRSKLTSFRPIDRREGESSERGRAEARVWSVDLEIEIGREGSERLREVVQSCRVLMLGFLGFAVRVAKTKCHGMKRAQRD